MTFGLGRDWHKEKPGGGLLSLEKMHVFDTISAIQRGQGQGLRDTVRWR